MYWLSFGTFGGSGTQSSVDTSKYWSDGVSIFRKDVRSGYLFLDQAITELGFDGVLGIDWSPITMEKY